MIRCVECKKIHFEGEMICLSCVRKIIDETIVDEKIREELKKRMLKPQIVFLKDTVDGTREHEAKFKEAFGGI